MIHWGHPIGRFSVVALNAKVRLSDWWRWCADCFAASVHLCERKIRENWKDLYVGLLVDAVQKKTWLLFPSNTRLRVSPSKSFFAIDDAAVKKTNDRDGQMHR